MDMILTKITHSIDSNKRDSYIYAVTLMGLFTFLFLGVEYFFVNVLSHIVSEDQTVLAQNYVSVQLGLYSTHCLNTFAKTG